MEVREVMSRAPVCCWPETPLREVAQLMVDFDCGEMPVEEVCRIMETHRVRRVPVIDQGGSCCGMVSQADLARCLDDEEEVGRVVQAVSQETKTPAQPEAAMATDPVCGMRVSVVSA